MTYKAVINNIESYERKFTETYLICGEHGLNETKERQLKATKSRKNAAVLALFDAETLYNENDYVYDEFLNEQIKCLEDGLNNTINVHKRDMTKESLDEAFYLEEYLRVYKKVFSSIFSLDDDNLKIVIKYANEKKKEHLKSKLKKEKKTVKKLIGDVNLAYNKYLEEKRERENTIPHVGVSEEEELFKKSLISKENIKYSLLINAIKDAFNASDSNFSISKELIENNFREIDIISKPKKMYLDGAAIKLSYDGIKLYSDVYSKVYFLTRENKNKLRRKLEKKL